jgi:zinc protease
MAAWMNWRESPVKNFMEFSSLQRRHKKMVFVVTLVLTLIFSSGHLFAIDAKREVLPNGMVLFFAEKHNLPIVKATLLIKASPVNESPGKAGLANLVADLLMEGTGSRTSEQISEETEFIGAGLDASVEKDFTQVSLSVLKKDMDKGFDLLSDIILNPVFPEEEITREKELIIGSLRQMEEEPGFIAGKAFREAVYGAHPYGRLTEGTQETIDSITRKDILEFHRVYYRPNNAILSVVGDLSHEELKTLLESYLSLWEMRGIPSEPSSEIAVQKEPVVIRIDRDLTQANIIIGHLGIRRSNPDYYAISVMNYILGGGGFASRLMTRIRDDMGLAYDVHSLFASNRDRGIFRAGVQTKNESAKTAIAVIIEEMKRMQGESVSDEELKDAKAFLTGSFPRRLDTMGKIANFLALTEFYGLGIDYDKRYPEYIGAITQEDVMRVAQKYLNAHVYVLVIVADLEKTGYADDEQE